MHYDVCVRARVFVCADRLSPLVGYLDLKLPVILVRLTTRGKDQTILVRVKQENLENYRTLIGEREVPQFVHGSPRAETHYLQCDSIVSAKNAISDLQLISDVLVLLPLLQV
jgi:hypothetical protein